MFVWSGSAWVSVAAEVESLAGYATQSYADSATGSKLVVPTSVAVGSGSGSVGTSGAVTFSGASSVSLNGCFSSTYDTYLVTGYIEASATDTLNFRVRLSGTDNSSANYNYQELRAESTAVLGARTTGASTFKLGVSESNNRNYFNLWLTNIAKAQNSIIVSEYTRGEPGMYFEKGAHLVTTAYDGFTVYPTSGTVTGTIRVYGMKN
jgi:hypothetical protein